MSTSPADRSPATRAKVLTLVVALLVYAFGAALPIPGIDPMLFSGATTRLGMGRISTFALGVTPLVSAILLFEVGRLIAPPFARWSAGPRRAFPLHVAVWTLALAVAALQAIKIVGVLDAMASRTTMFDADAMSEPVAVASMLGGTALLGWIGLRVTRAGAGDGLLILYAAPLMIVSTLKAINALQVLRFAGGQPTAPALAIDFAATALLVAGALASKPAPKAALGFGGGRLDPVPALIASAVAGTPALALWRFVWPDSGLDAWTIQAITSATAAALIALTALMRSVLPGAGAPRAVPWPATLATMIVCAGMPFLAGWGPRGLVVNGYTLVFVVGAALSVVDGLDLPRHLSSLRPKAAD